MPVSKNQQYEAARPAEQQIEPRPSERARVGTSRVQVVREERESRSRGVRLLHAGYGTVGVGILPKQRASKSASEKEKCAASVHSVEANAMRRHSGRRGGGKVLLSGAA